ncbi:MAG: hypothetical protein GY947_19040 [Rhodobacteraceae bacterium]|nr:hypothetical protein [Paracoccaceae bacterium]
MKSPLKFFDLHERRIILIILICLTAYGVHRHDAIFRTIGPGDCIAVGYNVDKFATDFPDGFFGFVPVSPYGLESLNGSDCPSEVFTQTGVKLPARLATEDEAGSLVDPMFASAIVVILLGLWLSMGVEKSYTSMRDQIQRDGMLEWSDADSNWIEVRRRFLSRSLAVLIFLMMFFGSLSAKFNWALPNDSDGWDFFITTIILAAIVGHRLGTVGAFGAVGQLVIAKKREMNLAIGHADNMGGARRLGEFLAFQGILLSIPIAWLSIWITLVIRFPNVFWNFDNWLWLHIALLIIALIVSYIGFVRPLLLFSEKFRRTKSAMLRTWLSMTSGQLTKAQGKFHASNHWADAHDAIAESTKITEVTERIASLPTYPLRTSVLGIFSISTLFPVVNFGLTLLAPEESIILNAVKGGIKVISELLV